MGKDAGLSPSSTHVRCHGDLVPPCVLVPRVPNHRRYGTPWSTISPSVTCLYGDMVPPEKWYPAHYYNNFFFKCPSKKHTHARIHVWVFCTIAQLYIFVVFQNMYAGSAKYIYTEATTMAGSSCEDISISGGHDHR